MDRTGGRGLASARAHGFNIFMMLRQRRTEEITSRLVHPGLMWLPVFYAIAYLPGFAAASRASWSGYYMHVVLGLWFTPLILGITYWRCRVFSASDLLVCPGVLAFGPIRLYPLIGAHHTYRAHSMVAAIGRHRAWPRNAHSGCGLRRQFLLTMQGSGALMRRETAAGSSGRDDRLWRRVAARKPEAFHSRTVLHFTNTRGARASCGVRFVS